jgi:N-carbamoylputrescine amidase
MRKRLLKVGLVQTKVSDNLNDNLDKAEAFIKAAAKKGAEVVCLQELFAQQYFAQTKDKKFFESAQRVPGPISRFLSNCASANRIVLIGGSIYERGADAKLYNTALIYGAEGELLGKYRKMHIPHDPNYYEQFYFTPGNLGYLRVDAGKAVIAPLICYDQWYPEAARINAMKGTEVIFYPTAIGWFKELKRDEPFAARRWEAAMRGHASLNGIFVAAVNRVGQEGDLRFWGGSFVADPFGEVIARASSSKEEVLTATMDLARIRVSQDGWRFLYNRRPQSYTDLTR